MLGGPGVKGGGRILCDGSSGAAPDQSTFQGQGDKEEEGDLVTEWTIRPGSSPKKSDLAEVYFYAKAGDSPYDADELVDDLFFTVDLTRLDVNGSMHADYEFNQKGIDDCGDTDPDTFCQERTANDVILAFDLERGGVPELRVFQFFIDGVNTPAPGPCAAAPGTSLNPGCYVEVTAPGVPVEDGSTQPAQFGALNSQEITAAAWLTVGCEKVTGDNASGCKLRHRISPNGNMEGFVDLTAFVGDGFDLCPGFSFASAKTRSSFSITSVLKDTTEQVSADVNICGSLLVEKIDGAGDPLPGASFTFDPNPVDPTQPPLVVADGGTGDAADGNDGYVCVDNALITYSGNVTESTTPPGYFGDDDTEPVSVTEPSTCAERILAGDTPDASFENLKGSIVIRKEKADGSLLGGATFTVTPSPVTGADSLDITDNGTGDVYTTDGVICIDDVYNLGDPWEYDIVEKTPPPGWFGDTDTETVIVDSPSTCAERLVGDPDPIPEGEVTADATFTNKKASLVIRKEAKDASTTATNDLLGGATFTITPSPVDGTSSLNVADNGPSDVYATHGMICIDNVYNIGAGNSYSIVEAESFTTYAEDSDTETVSQANLSLLTCAELKTAAGGDETLVPHDALFVNIPLSQIEVIFTSLAGNGVTVASIECFDESGNPVTPVAENGDPDPALDDTDEVYTDLLPNTAADKYYTCRINIDP